MTEARQKLAEILAGEEERRAKFDRRKIRSPVIRGKIISGQLDGVKDQLEAMIKNNWAATEMLNAVNKSGIKVKQVATLRNYLKKTFPDLYAQKLARGRKAKAPAATPAPSVSVQPAARQEQEEAYNKAPAARVEVKSKDDFVNKLFELQCIAKPNLKRNSNPEKNFKQLLIDQSARFDAAGKETMGWGMKKNGVNSGFDDELRQDVFNLIYSSTDYLTEEEFKYLKWYLIALNFKESEIN